LDDVTAILAIRNEEAYLGNCLRHLIANGLNVAIIDNGSTDGSSRIYRATEFGRHIVGVWDAPFGGAFALEQQLRLKQEISRRIGGDWILHIDADEMPHSYREGEALADGLRRLGRDGWNAVNFNEFVFLPIDYDYTPDCKGFPPLLYYYLFEPSSPRLMRAWRPQFGFSMLNAGGHVLDGEGVRLAPESFALRHYMMRDQEHALGKYVLRTFDATELQRGWHANRVGYDRDFFRFPPKSSLKRLARSDDRRFDLSEPRALHYWQWPRDGTAAVSAVGSGSIGVPR